MTRVGISNTDDEDLEALMLEVRREELAAYDEKLRRVYTITEADQEIDATYNRRIRRTNRQSAELTLYAERYEAENQGRHPPDIPSPDDPVDVDHDEDDDGVIDLEQAPLN